MKTKSAHSDYCLESAVPGLRVPGQNCPIDRRKMAGGGGLGSSAYLHDGGRYDPVADSWTAVARNGTPHGSLEDLPEELQRVLRAQLRRPGDVSARAGAGFAARRNRIPQPD